MLTHKQYRSLKAEMGAQERYRCALAEGTEAFLKEYRVRRSQMEYSHVCRTTKGKSR